SQADLEFHLVQTYSLRGRNRLALYFQLRSGRQQFVAFIGQSLQLIRARLVIARSRQLFPGGPAFLDLVPESRAAGKARLGEDSGQAAAYFADVLQLLKSCRLIRYGIQLLEHFLVAPVLLEDGTKRGIIEFNLQVGGQAKLELELIDRVVVFLLVHEQ